MYQPSPIRLYVDVTAGAKSIFISYRRDDTSGYGGRLHEALSARFGAARVFRDVDGIRPGADFVHSIEEAVASSGAVIALIGRDWLTVTDRAGRRRLDDPEDFVRLEIEAALQQGVSVIPVLVEGARVPSPSELPEPLANLGRHHGIELSEQRWAYDVGRLIARLEEVVADPPSTSASRAADDAEMLKARWTRRAFVSKRPPLDHLRSGTAVDSSPRLRSPAKLKRLLTRAAPLAAAFIAGIVATLLILSQTGMLASHSQSGGGSRPFAGSNAKITRIDGTVVNVQEETLDMSLCQSDPLQLTSGLSIPFAQMTSMTLDYNGSGYSVDIAPIMGKRIDGDMVCDYSVSGSFRGQDHDVNVNIPIIDVRRIDFRQAPER